MVEPWSRGLAKRLAQAEPEERTRFLESHRSQALMLTRVIGASGQEARLVSRLGGRPNLPTRLEWPRDNDGPLRFLAQLDLGSLSHHPSFQGLSATGVLLFFFNDVRHLFDRPGLALHIEQHEASTAPLRDAPPELRPLQDWPFADIARLLVRNRHWADATKYLPCWMLEARPVDDFPEEPHGFQFWPDDLRKIYINDYAATRQERVAAQLGEPPGDDEPKAWQLVKAGTQVPHCGWADALEWPPGSGWPYAWIHAAAFAGEVCRRIHAEIEWFEAWGRDGRQDHRLIMLQEMHEQRARRVEQKRDLLNRWAEEATEWLARSQDHNPFSALETAELEKFQLWVAGLGTGRDSVLSAECIMHATMARATDLLLGYAPDLAIRQLPASLLQMFMTRHSPFRHWSNQYARSLVRHQILGPQRVVQATDHGFTVPHRLLAQFDTDSTAGLEIGDAGVLQFWIPEQDWAEQRFDRCVAIDESH